MNTGSTTQRHHVPRRRGGHSPLSRLSGRSSWPPTATLSKSRYLLIYGELPTEVAAGRFPRQAPPAHDAARGHAVVLRRLSRATPIRWRFVSSVVGALSTFYQDSLERHAIPSRWKSRVYRLMAKLPTIAAYSYKKSIGQPFVYPRNDLTYCENFLQMMFAVPTRAVRGRSGLCRSAESAAHRPRRSRAELQHVDRADGRLVGCELVRLDFGRHLCPVGTAARRGQRSLRRDARSDSWPTAAT